MPGHRDYRDAAVSVGSRRLVEEVTLAAGGARDRGVVPDLGSPRLFYQLVGVSCAGDLESPY